MTTKKVKSLHPQREAKASTSAAPRPSPPAARGQATAGRSSQAAAGKGSVSGAVDNRTGRGDGHGRRTRQRDLSAHPDLDLLDVRLDSKDDQGHSTRWQVDVPTNFNAEVMRFVSQPNQNFADRASYVRWATLFCMDFLERLDPPEGPSNVAIWKAIAQEVSHSQARRMYLSSLEKSAQEAYELLGMGLEDSAINLVTRVLEHIRELPPADDYRKLCEQTFKNRFGHLLKRGKLAKLTFGEDGGED